MIRFIKSKTLILPLCALLLICTALPACAVSINSGLDALRGQWSRSEGPVADGISLEYSYFVPAAKDKCPLVVFLGGAGEGTTSGKELTQNKFANWSSDEFQARVSGANGMYILILKAPEPVYFDTCPLAPMFAAIEDFAANHNVDKSRIFVGGWCIGATGAARLCTNHPGFFSGLMLFSPRTVLTDYEARKIKNMKVWIFACYGDSYSPYLTYGYPSWQNVIDNTANKNNVRCTTCNTAPRAALLINHETWRLAEFDFSSSVLGDFTGLKTVDGSSSAVGSPQVISFMTDNGTPKPTETETVTETETETQTQTATAAESVTAKEKTEESGVVTGTQAATAKAAQPEEANKDTRRGIIIFACAAGVTAAAAAFAVIKKKRV